MNLEWIKKIDWESELTGEMKEISDLIGIDNLLILWNRFNKTHIYFSEVQLNKLRKKYISDVYEPSLNVKDIARDINVSEKFVYNMLSEKVSANQIDMFEK